jgi:hypothetical protein
MLAWETSEIDKTEANHKEAYDYFIACFEIVSPIEIAEVIEPFYETRAIVLMNYANVNPIYRVQFYDWLKKLVKKNHSLILSNERLQSASEQLEFLLY